MSSDRVAAAAEASGWATLEDTSAVLTADDARARESGMICTGDGLRVETLSLAVDVLRFVCDKSDNKYASADARRVLDALPTDLRARI